MQRREFTMLLGGAAAWPLAARAQQSAMPIVGFLSGASADDYVPYVAAFRQGMKEVGYMEGQNVIIEYRWAHGQYSQLSELAGDLVSRRVAVIFNGGSTPAALAAKAITRTIPIVFSIAGDPIKLGFVTSLSRPNSNLTGVTGLSAEVGPKRLELLHELIPTATKMALLVNPNSPAQTDPQSQDLRAAAHRLGLELHVLPASTEHEIAQAFANLTQLGVHGLVISPDVFFNGRREQLAALALRYAVPTIFQYREFAAAGGLMSYGGSLSESFRICGTYVGRILKGEKLADLPVQQLTKLELIINLKTAKALGLTFPITLLGRADEVIE
jgi:putative tryptophan/tyrosine transport system substrate-binding protein